LDAANIGEMTMGIEIEKKYKLTEELEETLKQKLQEAGAQYISKEFEENTLFSGGTLDQKNAVLRLRHVDGKAILTYKERYPSDSPIKRQREDETKIENPLALIDILDALGFKPSLVYEKIRETWAMSGTLVTIDQLPFGFFLEIEGEEKSILETENVLGISELPAEMATYPALAAQFGTKEREIILCKF
jgi:adenylate cyclase, class 2